MAAEDTEGLGLAAQKTPSVPEVPQTPEATEAPATNGGDSSSELEDTAPTPATPVNAPGRAEIPVEGRAGADTTNGSNSFISWGARSDVGLVRSHNEDSFLVRPPCFAVCDGMGGHAAGEVASAIAVQTIGDKAPATADDTLLGVAVEEANAAVIEGAESGKGKPGMGCTASVALIEGNRLAVAHVGDSRIYLLHAGTLVRVTRDHSYVEELVDAGQITADEARVHPSRSIITRALGSDPDMYADHFSLDVSTGDRLIICSDGLSSMVPDDQIETLAISSVTPQQAADNLVSAALTAGGADNVTVIVVDVINDGVADANRKRFAKRAAKLFIGIIATIIAVFAILFLVASNFWYLGANGDTVGVYQGISGSFLGLSFSQLVETTAVEISDLPSSVQTQLTTDGISVDSEEEALATVESYRQQIDEEKTRAAQKATEVAAEGGSGATAESESTTSSDATSSNDTTTTTEGGE